ncbi:MAG: ribonuclease E/G, partial [Magnetococcales bacterium]|nr:ribonuclease E/G [Magnetococcales bacterium]
LIIRTAGLGRTKREIIRDLNYLLRLWKKILENASQADGPTLIHEEGDLILRTIRDLYSTDMSEILIDGQEGYRRGKDFMRLLMPRYLKVVQHYKETQPIFSRFQVENQIESMHDRVIQLKAGGYLVIEATEALVSIDINSGRSTREKDVETTAFKTNLQAADEIARQLRLRDLGGLIVIDFIDMEEKKHNLEVERQMREALKLDRAKIQLGKISQFGLLELSRQRMKPTFSETNRMECPRCKGLGTIRSVESSAFHLFRMLEEDLSKNRYIRIVYRTSWDVANYLLNHKRAQLAEMEAESLVTLLIQGDESLQTPEYRVERIDRPKAAGEEAGDAKSGGRGQSAGRGGKGQPNVTEEGRAKGGVKAPPPPLPPPVPELPDDDEEDEEIALEPESRTEGDGSAAPATPGEPVEKKKRRRRRRRKSGQSAQTQASRAEADGSGESLADTATEAGSGAVDASSDAGERESDAKPQAAQPDAAPVVRQPVVTAPTVSETDGTAIALGGEMIKGVRATAAPGLFILSRPEPKPEPTTRVEASIPVTVSPDAQVVASDPSSDLPESIPEVRVKPASRRRTRSRSAKGEESAGDAAKSKASDAVAEEATLPGTVPEEAASAAIEEGAEPSQTDAKPARRRSTRTPRKPKATPEPVELATVAVDESVPVAQSAGEDEVSEEEATADGKSRAPRRRRRRRTTATARRGAGEEADEVGAADGDGDGDGDGGSISDASPEALPPPWES